MRALRDIESEVARLAAQIGASEDQLPSYGVSKDGGYPHIEVDNSLYHYIVVERGQELERKSTANYAELLYWVFANATHALAFDFELKHRKGSLDCRRIAFSKQIELLNLIDPEMGIRRSREIAEILGVAPYHDKA